MGPETKTEKNVKQAVPFFGVTDMQASLRFYQDGLGFTMKYQWIDEGKLRWCWLELVAQVIAPKPFTPDASASLGSYHLKDWHSALGVEERRTAHLGNDRGHLPRTKFSHAARVQPVFITKRQVIEQVLHHVDVFLLQPLGQTRAYAFYVLYFCVEFQHGCIELM